MGIHNVFFVLQFQYEKECYSYERKTRKCIVVYFLYILKNYQDIHPNYISMFNRNPHTTIQSIKLKYRRKIKNNLNKYFFHKGTKSIQICFKNRYNDLWHNFYIYIVQWLAHYIKKSKLFITKRAKCSIGFSVLIIDTTYYFNQTCGLNLYIQVILCSLN